MPPKRSLTKLYKYTRLMWTIYLVSLTAKRLFNISYLITCFLKICDLCVSVCAAKKRIEQSQSGQETSPIKMETLNNHKHTNCKIVSETWRMYVARWIWRNSIPSVRVWICNTNKVLYSDIPTTSWRYYAKKKLQNNKRYKQLNKLNMYNVHSYTTYSSLPDKYNNIALANL